MSRVSGSQEERIAKLEQALAAKERDVNAYYSELRVATDDCKALRQRAEAAEAALEAELEKSTSIMDGYLQQCVELTHRAEAAETSLALLEKPTRISAKTLYARLVAVILREWASRWPMAEYVDPESAVRELAGAARESGKEPA